MNKASAYPAAECPSHSVSSLPELLRACEPQEVGQSGLSAGVGDSVGEGVTGHLTVPRPQILYSPP